MAQNMPFPLHIHNVPVLHTIGSTPHTHTHTHRHTFGKKAFMSVLFVCRFIISWATWAWRAEHRLWWAWLWRSLSCRWNACSYPERRSSSACSVVSFCPMVACFRVIPFGQLMECNIRQYCMLPKADRDLYSTTKIKQTKKICFNAYTSWHVRAFHNMRPRGLDALLGHLLLKIIPVIV